MRFTKITSPHPGISNDDIAIIVSTIDDLLTEGIFSLDKNQHIIFANRALLNMFGYKTIQEMNMLGVNLLNPHHEEIPHLHHTLHTKSEIANEKVLFKKRDGLNLWADLSCRKINVNGSSFYNGIIRNTASEREKDEKLMRTVSEIDRLTMELDRFIYSASHDIRSPITSALGLINVMKLDIHDNAMLHYLHLLEDRIKKLDKFVCALSGYARNLKQPYHDQKIDFRILLESVVAEFSEHVNHGCTDKVINIVENAVFYSDLQKIKMILSNVIKNAFDYTDDGKTEKAISIAAHVEDEQAIIEIFDNGIGIAASHLPYVFDIFYRASQQSKGSGLGLYTAREVTVKLGGIISIQSTYGIGTLVKIELPNSRKGKLINHKQKMRKHL